jgi:hypothetical protein
VSPPLAPQTQTAPLSDVLAPAWIERLGALPSMADALVAGRFCLDLLERVVPCRALLLHVFDAARSDFLVVDAAGAGSEGALLLRVSPRDPLLSVSIDRTHAFSWNDLSCAPVLSVERLARIGGARRILHAPVKVGQRSFGLIELIDPLDGAAFDRRREGAVFSVASRYAEFVAEHGVVTDLSLVAPHAYAR